MLKRIIGMFALVSLLTIIYVACDGLGSDGDDDGEGQFGAGGPGSGGQGGGQSSVRDLTSLQVSKLAIQTQDSNLTQQGQLPASCQAQQTGSGAQAGPVNGLCITPTNVEGFGQQINLTTDSTSGLCGPARLLQLGTQTGEGLQRGGIDFDLASPSLVGGETTLDCEDYLTNNHSGVTIELPYIDVKFSFRSEFWTLRYIFEANPLTEEPEFAKNTCEYSLYDDAIEGWAFLPTTVRVQRGDVLLCKKADETSACADSDFQWLDVDSDSFVSTRPSNAFQLAYIRSQTVGQQADGTWGDVFCNTNCERDEAYCGISSAGFPLAFTIESANRFGLSSQIIAYKPKLAAGQASPSGALDVDYLNGAYRVYSYTSPSGVATRGSQLEIDVQLDLSNFLFIPDYDDEDDFAALDDATVVKSIQIRDMWRRQELMNFGHVSDSKAVVEISITDTATFPAKEANSEPAD